MINDKVGFIERETKLAGWAGFELPKLDHVLDGVVAMPLPEQQLEATYYDTADLRLARAGISVRFRTGEGTAAEAADGKWTVKLPEGDAGPSLIRREIDVLAPGRQVPPAVAALVRGHVRFGLLAPVGVLRTRRRGVALRNDAGIALAEICDDEVSVLDGRRVAERFREIEVELTDDATPDLLSAVLVRLLEAGAVAADQTPKIVRALGPVALEPPDVRVADLDGNTATLRDVVAAAVAASFTRLLQHDPGVRLGGDPEDVHQARVAARRLRSDLRTFRDLLDDERAGPLRDELQWLGAELGVVRDNDVLLERLRAQTALLPAAATRVATGLLRRLEAERDAARMQMLAALDSDRYLALLDALADASVRPPVTEEAGALARRALPGFVRVPWRHLRKAVDALGQHPEDEALHVIRIRAKRARYAAEAVAPVLGKPAKRFARAMAGVQSVLGDLQDAVVAEDWLRIAGARAPAAQALVAGELIGVQREAMAASRRDWPQAWDEAARKSLRSWLS